MPTPILATKLYIPRLRPHVVIRPRLIERLNEGLHRKLTLISAPAGFGKTTLASAWVASCDRQVAWLSLDEGDSDPTRFLTYLVAALRTIAANIGEGVLGVLQSPQPTHQPPTASILTALLNEITTIPDNFVLVLDDYHVIDAKPIDHALTYLVEHLPPQMHLAIATREDPPLPLARLRVGGHLTELRAVDLRFTPSEAAAFLNQVMGLNLSAQDIAALETRTEGWIAGLQLAAISMQGHKDTISFIKSFTGSHHFVLDYLVEEVLQQQPESVQNFLLRTSILDRMSGPLCDAVLLDATTSGQETLEYLERANLFIVPLDNERRWYMPLQFRGAMISVLNWLESLPTTILDARPSLWVTYASALTMTGQPISNVEEKLQAAEAALQETEPDDKIRDLAGHIAAIRAMLAVPANQVETIIAQSRRALEYLHPNNLPVRATAHWTLGYAYQLQGDRAAASQAYTEVISLSQASGNIMVTIAATTCLGQVQEAENQLSLAAESYWRVLQLAGDPPWPAACEAYLGLARVCYQWNDLEAAEQHGQQSFQLAMQMESVDTPAACGVFLARLKLARGDVASATALLAKAEQFVRQHNFVHWMPEVAAVQVLTLLHQGHLAAAAHLAQTHGLPLSQARVHLAQGDPSAALAVLESWRGQMEAKGWQDERLKVMVLQAVALQAHGEKDKAVQLLGDALTLAEPGGFIRIFVDEGPPMAHLLSEAEALGMMPDSIGKLLALFKAEEQKREDTSSLPPPAQPLLEPLSRRELEVLHLMAQGLSNQEMCERLFLALDTVKGHNRKIFDKLQVQRRTEAVARARELGLL